MNSVSGVCVLLCCKTGQGMVGTIGFSRRGSQETFADQLIGLQGLLSKIEALHGDLRLGGGARRPVRRAPSHLGSG